MPDFRVLLRALLLLMLGGAASVQVRAEQPPAAQETTETRIEFSDEIPEVFRKDAPVGIADLEQIERHVVQLIPRLKECTVGLRIGRAQGSGVIISPDGIIATAAHVVGSPGRVVVVVMPDGAEHSALTLGRNQTLDASLLKIRSKRTDWPHASLATTVPAPGDWCLAIGHPGGFQQDRGLVTRLGRVIIANKHFVQSDCELIGGDSGGPLFDMSGHVLAVSSRIGEPTDYNFHVPADAYKRDWDKLIAGDDFRTHSGAYLGVSGDPVEGGGLKVTKVFEDSPAADAGVKVGDVIMTFQGKVVATLDELVARVGDEMPGRRANLELLRDGKTVKLKVQLAMRWD
jgi:serine protease Do